MFPVAQFLAKEWYPSFTEFKNRHDKYGGG